MKLLEGVQADATYSPCHTYRYTLTRDWFPKTPERKGGPTRRHVLWIMLNPSTATHLEDDPTIRKCQKFARAWGYNGITVANLFALRSTDPKALYVHPDPVGPANDDILAGLATAGGVGLVVAAWGEHGALRNRGLIVLERLVDAGATPMRLGRPTKGGHPWHPLYRADDTTLEPAAIAVTQRAARPSHDGRHGQSPTQPERDASHG